MVPRKSSIVLEAVLKNEEGIWPDHLFAERLDLLSGVAFRFVADRDHLENPDAITPDEQTDEEKVLSQAGDEHEQAVLNGYKASGCHVVKIPRDENQFDLAHAATLTAICNRTPIIYQAALRDRVFAGYADFLTIDPFAKYQVWDTKLSLSPKPVLPDSTLLLLRNACGHDRAGAAGADRNYFR